MKAICQARKQIQVKLPDPFQLFSPKGGQRVRLSFFSAQVGNTERLDIENHADL
jgi:hypothetical protein